jgi:hypothetical protein
MRRETGGGIAIAMVITGLLLLLPALYFLSVGPAVWLIHSGWLNETAAEVVYTPLILLCESCSPAENVLSAYVELWEPTTAVMVTPANAPLPSVVPPPPP